RRKNRGSPQRPRQQHCSGLLLLELRLLPDDFAQAVGNLPVTRNGRLLSGRRVAIDIVPHAVADEDTPLLLQLSDERLALHTSSSTGCCWAVAGAGERS